MSATIADLVERLTEEGQETLDFFRGLPDDAWEKPVYSEETDWTVRTLLAHFVWTEEGMQRLYERIAAGGEGASEDFDVDRWNASRARKTADLTPDVLMDKYEEVRASYIEWVKTLDEETLERRGRHASQGIHPLKVLVTIPYHHNTLHIKDIKTALGLD